MGGIFPHLPLHGGFPRLPEGSFGLYPAGSHSGGVIEYDVCFYIRDKCNAE